MRIPRSWKSLLTRRGPGFGGVFFFVGELVVWWKRHFQTSTFKGLAFVWLFPPWDGKATVRGICMNICEYFFLTFPKVFRDILMFVKLPGCLSPWQLKDTMAKWKCLPFPSKETNRCKKSYPSRTCMEITFMEIPGNDANWALKKTLVV